MKLAFSVKIYTGKPLLLLNPLSARVALTSQLFFTANQLTGFYVRAALAHDGLRWKLDKTQVAKARNVMQSLNTFIRISGLMPEVKKSHWSMIMKISLFIQKSPSKARFSRTSVVCSKYTWGGGGSEGQCQSRKIWLFLLSFKLGSSIPST